MRESKLDRFFSLIVNAGIDMERMNQADMRVLKDLSNSVEDIIWINNHQKLEPVFVNNAGLKYYGYERNELAQEGFELYSKLIHPDYFNDVHRTITHFAQHPERTFFMPYLVKHYTGTWRWTFSEARTLNYSRQQKAVYVIALVYDMEDVINNLEGLRSPSLEEDLARYKTLTEREKEVLYLIADEKTSVEIARLLHIETSTVDTHRKHLIRKLGVRSSIGLVRFALLFRSS